MTFYFMWYTRKYDKQILQVNEMKKDGQVTFLKDQNYEQGQLTIKLQFKNVLPKKLFLVYIPIYERKIIFDSYFNVQVHQ